MGDMLDLALLTKIDLPPLPSPPPIVEERLHLSSMARVALQDGERLVSDFGTQVEELTNKLRFGIDLAKVDHSDATPEILAQVTELITEWEAIVSKRARDHERAAKTDRKEAKKAFEADPSLGAVFRSISGRLLELDRRLVNALVEQAMLMRAFRSDIERALGLVKERTFNEPSEMASYLRARLAK